MNARKLKKKRNLFFQNFQLLNFDKKQMASNLFEFVKLSMMGTFSIKFWASAPSSNIVYIGTKEALRKGLGSVQRATFWVRRG